MPAPEPIKRPSGKAASPLSRRLWLRPALRDCARPELVSGNRPENQTTNLQLSSGLLRWQRAARFRRTLVVVKRPLVRTLEPRERKRRDSHRGQVDKSGLPTG